MRATAIAEPRADSVRQPSNKDAGMPARRSGRRQQHVLFQAVDLRLADIFADLLVELGPGLPGSIFHQLGGHARADAGDQQELLALAGVQIDLHERLAVELARLLSGELLVEQKLVELENGRER